MPRWPTTLTLTALVWCWGLPGGLLTPRHAAAGLTHRVSVASSGAQANSGSYSPHLSADGRFVAFRSAATTLVPGDTNGTWDIFVHDRDADGDGVFDEPGALTTHRVSVASSGTQADLGSFEPSLSADGRFVAFSSEATNLVFRDTKGHEDVFVHDRLGVVQAVCGGFAATIVETPGPDLLWGTPGSDVIHGLGGNDRLSGDSGHDLLCGGSGNDILIGGWGHDQLFGGPGNDRLDGGTGMDLLDGGPGSDLCRGGGGRHPDTAECETVREVP